MNESPLSIDVHIRIEKEMVKRIEHLAFDQGISRSQLIRDLLEIGLRQVCRPPESPQS